MRKSSNLYSSDLLATILLSACLSLPASADYDWSDMEAALASNTGESGQASGGALIITHRGVVVYENVFGNWTSGDEDTVRPIYSASKPVAAVVALATAADFSNPFDLTDPIKDHFPAVDNWHSEYGQITVAQTLSHLSGIPQVFPLNAPCLGNYWVGSQYCARQIARKNPAALPGSEFIYTGGSFQVMGYAAEQASGASWHDLAAQYLFAPCDFTTMRWQGTRNPWIAGGVISDTHDGARFAEILRTGQCINANNQIHTVISYSDLVAMRSDQTQGVPITTSPYPDDRRYGYGLFRSDYTGSSNLEIYSHGGAAGAFPWFDTSRDYSAFMMMEESTGPGATKANALVEIILPLLEAQIDAN